MTSFRAGSSAPATSSSDHLNGPVSRNNGSVMFRSRKKKNTTFGRSPLAIR
jgi:hypothetical protein